MPTTLRLERSANGKLGCRLSENLVSSVDEGSPAATAGLRAGQVIKSVNGRNCTQRQGASDLLQIFMRQQSMFTFTFEVEELRNEPPTVAAAPPPLKKRVLPETAGAPPENGYENGSKSYGPYGEDHDPGVESGEPRKRIGALEERQHTKDVEMESWHLGESL